MKTIILTLFFLLTIVTVVFSSSFQQYKIGFTNPMTTFGFSTSSTISDPTIYMVTDNGGEAYRVTDNGGEDYYVR